MSLKKDLQKVFTDAISATGEEFELIGNAVIVSRLPKREIKSQSNLVLSTGDYKQQNSFAANQPEFVKVLAVGKGYYNEETNEDVPLEVTPGAVIEVGRNSVNWFSSFGAIMDNIDKGRGIGLTLYENGRMKFKSEEAFNKFMDFFYDAELLA